MKSVSTEETLVLLLARLPPVVRPIEYLFAGNPNWVLRKLFGSFVAICISRSILKMSSRELQFGSGAVSD